MSQRAADKLQALLWTLDCVSVWLGAQLIQIRIRCPHCSFFSPSSPPVCFLSSFLSASPVEVTRPLSWALGCPQAILNFTGSHLSAVNWCLDSTVTPTRTFSYMAENVIFCCSWSRRVLFKFYSNFHVSAALRYGIYYPYFLRRDEIHRTERGKKIFLLIPLQKPKKIIDICSCKFASSGLLLPAQWHFGGISLSHRGVEIMATELRYFYLWFPLLRKDIIKKGRRKTTSADKFWHCSLPLRGLLLRALSYLRTVALSCKIQEIIETF